MGIVTTVQNYMAGNENMMKELVANYGPLTSVISVTSYFQQYKSGILYDTTCNSNCASVNHAIVIVGYGRNATSNLDYWIVKNSWVCIQINSFKSINFKNTFQLLGNILGTRRLCLYGKESRE